MTVREMRESHGLTPTLRDDLNWYKGVLGRQGLRPVTVNMYIDDYLRFLEFCMKAQVDHWDALSVEQYRLTHHVQVLACNGDSYRLADAKRRRAKPAPEPTDGA